MKYLILLLKITSYLFVFLGFIGYTYFNSDYYETDILRPYLEKHTF